MTKPKILDDVMNLDDRVHEKRDWTGVIAGLVLLGIIILLVYGLGGGIVGQQYSFDRALGKVEKAGFDVKSASIPETYILVRIKTCSEFISLARGVGITIMYKSGYSFYGTRDSSSLYIYIPDGFWWLWLNE